MKYIWFLVLLTISVNHLSAQTEKFIDKDGGNNYYGHYFEEIKSINKLPKNIQFNLNSYLTLILPTIVDSIKFSHGQVIDLEKLFAEEPKTFNRNRVIPKYELTFHVKNKSIGFKNYNLEIGLDQYGQILETNWPKEILKLENFKSLKEISVIALNNAKNKKIEYQSYEVDIVYSKNNDKMIWIIKLLLKHEGTKKEFYVMEFNWNSTKIVNENVSFQNTVY